MQHYVHKIFILLFGVAYTHKNMTTELLKFNEIFILNSQIHNIIVSFYVMRKIDFLLLFSQ